ncbi:alpha/beta hydrolase [Bdellovibrio bacteriovorus]|uniref:alpha/beta fold hydrolase n=1 Tax=Bdellovibrio bacteriovorus TaxID=959 RepID=UPI0021D1CD78|nr:alpha/beta hydrolase [Bdellovibrio bacteriovorus]UXR66080.1 alpha/beta hydrolase [Bdellovibrio bacteriovorus]
MTTSQDLLPTVFLPGFLCDERVWADTISQLTAPGPFVSLHFKDCKDLQDMLNLLIQLPYPRFNLIGFSMGGYVAELFATQYPERLQHLALIAVNVGPLSERERQWRLNMKEMLGKFQYRGMNEKELSRFLHPNSLSKAHVTNTIIDMSAGYTSEMYLNQMMATLDRKDLGAELAQLSCPILLVAGRDDRVVPLKQIESLHQQVPQAKLHIIDECGHYVPLEKPAELAQILNRALLAYS